MTPTTLQSAILTGKELDALPQLEPKLKFCCLVCGIEQDPSEIRQDFSFSEPLRCRDYSCNGPVEKALTGW